MPDRALSSAKPSPPVQRLGIVGSGRVARALAWRLCAAGLPVRLHARSPEKAADALAMIAGAGVEADLVALIEWCDALALCVADDALPRLVETLVPALGACTPARRLVFHVSGRSGADLLAPLRDAGARTAAIHPAMTFTGDPALEAQRMAGARFAVTAPDAATQAWAEALVALLGGVAVPVAEAQRSLYHAALCHAANHLVTLIAGAEKALAAAGVAEPRALMAPLVEAALGNSLAHGFAALSGPLLRGDAGTIAGHLDALRAASPSVLPAYRAMALATLDQLAERPAPGPRDAERDHVLRDLLTTGG